LATYAYDANGRRSTLTRDISITTRYNYDAAGQLLEIAHQGRAGGTLASVAYDYDDMGRRIAQTRDGTQTDTYDYDAAGQLIGVDYNVSQTSKSAGFDNNGSSGTGSLPVSSDADLPHTETFTYDALGNRLDHTDTATGLSEHYETNNLNQYTQITRQTGLDDTDSNVDDTGSTIDDNQPAENSSDDTTLDAPSSTNQDEGNNDSQDPQETNPTVNQKQGTVNLTYDAKGNLLADGKHWYAYDAQNRLTEVRTLTDSAQFYYDPSNRCILRVYARLGVNGWETDEKASVAMIYDHSWNLLADYNLNGTLQRNYIHGTKTDEVIRAGNLYPLADAQGSVIAAANETGGLESSYTYEAFGRLTSASKVPPEYRFLFAGRERLAKFGLTEMRNRYYSTSLGRFINADPSGFNGGINLYAYAFNNPVDYTDPFGLDSLDVSVVTTGNTSNPDQTGTGTTGTSTIITGTTTTSTGTTITWTGSMTNLGPAILVQVTGSGTTYTAGALIMGTSTFFNPSASDTSNLSIVGFAGYSGSFATGTSATIPLHNDGTFFSTIGGSFVGNDVTVLTNTSTSVTDLLTYSASITYDSNNNAVIATTFDVMGIQITTTNLFPETYSATDFQQGMSGSDILGSSPPLTFSMDATAPFNFTITSTTSQGTITERYTGPNPTTTTTGTNTGTNATTTGTNTSSTPSGCSK